MLSDSRLPRPDFSDVDEIPADINKNWLDKGALPCKAIHFGHSPGEK